MVKTKPIARTGAAGQAAVFFLSLASGFMLSGVSIAGVSSFADISAAGALPLPHSPAVLAGSLVRCIVSDTVGENIVKLAAMIMIVIFKLFFESKADVRSSAIASGVSVFVSGMAVSAVIGNILHQIIFYVFYGAVTGFISYSSAVVVEGICGRTPIDLRSGKSCAYAAVYIVIVASLCSAEIPGINPGIILGAAVTMTGAYHYRCIGGVVCGAMTACGAFAASPECGMTAALIPAVGFLTGYLYRQKAGIAGGFFIAANFAAAVFRGVTADIIVDMLNIIAGTTLFIVFSPYFTDKWIITGENNEALPEIMGARMSFLADSIANIRNESGRIADFLSKNDDTLTEIECSAAEVCKSCYRRLECWYNSQENTRCGFQKLSRLAEITRDSFPFELAGCLRKEELARAFEKTACEKTAARLMLMNTSDSRRLLSEQIKMTEEIIGSAGGRIGLRYSETLSRSIRRKLTKYGFSVKNVLVCYTENNRFFAEIYFAAEDAPSSLVRICDLISDEVRVPLDCAEPVCSGKEVRVRLYERTRYSVEAYGASFCADESNETGDTTAVFSDGTGASYVVLSDGMGTGKEASLESRMVVSMFRRLISSGVTLAAAIRLINSIMLTKSRTEAFATLDAVRIDLDTCTVTVIKSGAAATLIRHGGQVIKITSPTFPIGIFHESDTYFKDITLEENDIIIMFSDGINENEYRFIKELLLSSSDLKSIVDEICGKAELFNPDIHEDDITVIGVKINA